MSLVKSKSRNKMGDNLLDYCLVTCIVPDIFFEVDEDAIIESFMATRRARQMRSNIIILFQLLLMAPPKPPPPGSLFCPIQEKIEDIRIHVWNTSKGLESWYHLQEAMKRRQTSLAPFIIVAQGRTIPVTPLENPKTKMSSYFIVQMIDDDDKQFKVNCLLRDTDAYFMGFQRELVSSEEEQWLEEKKRMERNQEACSSKGKKKNKTEEASSLNGKKKTEEQYEKGNFYRFKEEDMTVPEFLNATKLNIEAGYRKSPKPGGRAAIRHMFRAFSRYQDGTVTNNELETACYCFMGTVCEPTRLFSLFLEVSRRIAAGEFPSPLSGLSVKNTDNWGRLGNVVLAARLVDRLEPYRLLPQWCRDHNLVIMRELIGHRGEILFIRIDIEKIGISKGRLEEIQMDAASRNTGPAYRLDPGFELVVID